MRRAAVAVLLVAAVLGAGALWASCRSPTGDEPTPTSTPTTTAGPATPDAPTTGPTSTGTPVPSPSPTPTPTEAPTPLESVRVAWAVEASGFERPLQVLSHPGTDDVLVVEQGGRVRTLDGEVVLDLSDRVTRAGNEQGLLALAFHPDGSRLFVHYSATDGSTTLSSFPADDLAADRETVLLTEPQPARNHNGGSVVFTPEGALVLALGDGGGGGDQFGNGQNTDSRLGGLLRLDVDDPGTVRPWPDNPFLDGGAPELWTYGLRNPWRIDTDGEVLYVADVGQDAVEEVSFLPLDDVTGANFGWPRLEGSQCYASADCSAEGTVRPSVELRHADGACSIIGGVVVPPGHATGLDGAFLFSDVCDTRLQALRAGPDGAEHAILEGGTLPDAPLGFGRTDDGAVWVATINGEVRRLAPA